MPWIEPSPPEHQRPRKNTFKGKSVVLIGPAEHIGRRDQAAHIKSFDVVARMNSAFPIPSAVARCTTERCDVLYLRRRIPPHPHWNAVGEFRLEPRALWMPDSIHIENRDHRHCTTVIHPSVESELVNALGGTNPNMALLALWDILTEHPSRVYMTGVTFHQTPYVDGHVPWDPEAPKTMVETQGKAFGHDADIQMKFFRKLTDRVEVDSELEKLLK